MQSYRKPLLAAVVLLAAVFIVSAFSEPKKRKQVITQTQPQTKSPTVQTPPLQTQTLPIEKEQEISFFC